MIALTAALGFGEIENVLLVLSAGAMGVSLFRNPTLPARVLPVLWAVLYVYGRLVGHFGKPEKFYGS